MLEPSDSPEAVTAVMNLNRRSKWSLSLALSTPLSDSALRKLKIDFRPRTICWQCPRRERRGQTELSPWGRRGTCGIRE